MDDLDVVHALALRIIVAEQLAAYHDRDKSYRQVWLENISQTLANSRAEEQALSEGEKTQQGWLTNQYPALLAKKISELEQDRLSAEQKVQRAEAHRDAYRTRADYLLSRFSASIPSDILEGFRSHYFDLVNVEFNGVEGWVVGTPWTLDHLKHFRPDIAQERRKSSVEQSMSKDAVSSVEPLVVSDGNSKTTPKERLMALKELLDESLIDEEEFHSRRKIIIDGI